MAEQQDRQLGRSIQSVYRCRRYFSDKVNLSNLWILTCFHISVGDVIEKSFQVVFDIYSHPFNNHHKSVPLGVLKGSNTGF